MYNTRTLAYTRSPASTSSTLSLQPSIADVREEIRSYRDTLDDRFNHLTSAFEMHIFSIESSLSTAQSDMIVLADRVSICECKLFTLKGQAQVNPTLPAIFISHGSQTTAANINISTYPSVTDIVHEVKLRDEKKTNIVISGLHVNPNKPDCDLVIDLFTDIGIQNITPRLVKRIGKNMHETPQLLLIYLRTENDLHDIFHDAKLLRK